MHLPPPPPYTFKLALLMFTKNFFSFSTEQTETKLSPQSLFFAEANNQSQKRRKPLRGQKSVVLGTFCRSYDYELTKRQLIILNLFVCFLKVYYLCDTNSLI